MKNFLIVIRWVVGLLFIFSGLVKVNDPLGLSYKMQEFFEVWGWLAFDKYTLALSIFMNTLEVVCGVCLLTGQRMKLIVPILLMLILFFTFLTGYALLSGKIKTCGCLGDCLPLTPLMSFLKDLLLLVLIGVLFIYRKNIHSSFPVVLGDVVMLVSILVCGLLQERVINHLPFIDCLPYKTGNNIVAQMQKPSNYVADSINVLYEYNKKGQQVTFDQDHFPDDFDSTYVFVNRTDKIIRQAINAPKIVSFTLTDRAGNDTTQAIFAIPRYVMLFGNNFPSDATRWLKETLQIKQQCDQQKIPFFYVTSQPDEQLQLLMKEGIPILKTDATLIKTAARVNSTYFLMQKATITGKYSYKDVEKVSAVLKNSFN